MRDHGFPKPVRFGGLRTAFRVLAPVGNETPAQRVERALAGLMVAPDDKELLARCGIPAGWIIVDAVIMHVETLDDAIAVSVRRSG